MKEGTHDPSLEEKGSDVNTKSFSGHYTERSLVSQPISRRQSTDFSATRLPTLQHFFKFLDFSLFWSWGSVA